MKGKRNLETIVYDTAVGATMTAGGIRMFETVHKFGQQIGSEIQEYVGGIGSGMVEYGLPGLYAVAAVSIIYKAVQAIDRLQVEKQRDRLQVEKQEYRARNRIYEVLKDNVSQFFTAGIAGFLVGAGTKYFGSGEMMMNPVIYGAAVTPIVNVIEFTMVPNKRGNVKKTVQGDIGCFSGNVLGYTLASLL